MESESEISQDTIDSWFKANPESVDAFIKELNKHEHDYNSIVHALAAVAYQAARVMNRGPQGGISGFQAGGVMWSFIKHWMHIDSPMRLVDYQNMLYPQYEHDFEKRITKETWEWLQKEAKKKLSEPVMQISESVGAHWSDIVAGKVPFGYIVEGD
jgi:hypothetical protein